jgi:uncharacterized protein YjbI with pentapeptide repeats
LSDSNTPPGWTPELLRQALTEILERHKLWVQTNHAEGEQLSLRGANLIEADLEGADLWMASMRRANLVQVDFWAANLDQACFTKATFAGADFVAANLEGAGFRADAAPKAVAQSRKLRELTPR